jgi:hypothetical protein
MPLVCPRCGSYALGNAAQTADSTRCADCAQPTAANILPLFVVTGASGSGKTCVTAELRCRLPECVVLDKDLLWGRAAADQFTNNWLRIAYGVAQGGRHTLICGTMMPADFAVSEDRGLVGPIHFLNLTCSDEVRERRLRARLAWRESAGDAFIARQRRCAHWLLEHATMAYDPPMPTIDTTALEVAEVADAIARWVGRRPG